jgi:hypothetical protein
MHFAIVSDEWQSLIEGRKNWWKMMELTIALNTRIINDLIWLIQLSETFTRNAKCAANPRLFCIKDRAMPAAARPGAG